MFLGIVYVYGLKYVFGDFVIILDVDFFYYVSFVYFLVMWWKWDCELWDNNRKVWNDIIYNGVVN